MLIPVIAGPTASGKSKLAVLTAEKVKDKTCKVPVIISADSRQIYKELPITTAHPPAEYLRRYRHEFIGILDLSDDYSSGRFADDAKLKIRNAMASGEVPIVAGGSG